MGNESTAENTDSFIGRVVADRYRIIAPLARGGMGRVYRAMQEPLGREVALKVLDIAELKQSTGSDDAGKGFAERFFLEAASVAKLSHPNTVTVFDYGTMDDGACYIAMELLTGQTLGELISADAPLAPRRVLRIALQICASLSEAHRHGLIHRDLKPGNVMLIEHGADREFAKVLDFGLVKRENESSDLTASGALVGTPKYMAPEQVTGHNVGAWSDVYALGAVMYHMLTGEPPFVGDSKFALLAAHLNVELDRMAEKVPGLVVPTELEEVVRRCMAKAPKDRYPSMEALAEALLVCADASAIPMSSVPSSDSLRVLMDSGNFSPSTGSGERLAVRPAPVAAVSAVGSEVSATRPAESSRLPLRVGLVLLVVVGFGAFALARSVFAPSTPVVTGSVVATNEPTNPDAPPDTVGPGAAVAGEGAPSGNPSGAVAAPVVAAEQSVLLASEPPGAHARQGEFDLGDTPVTLVIPEGDTWTVQLSAAGYASRTVTATAGQGEVRARLSRLRRPTGSAPATMELATMEPATMEPATMEPATMEPATMEPATMAPAPHTTTGRTDNRDPWANP